MFSWDLFLKVPIVRIVRGHIIEEIDSIMPLYANAGLTTIEITMNTAGAANIIKHIADHYPDNINIGAGTVCTPQDLDDALNAGAQFIVTPIINPDVIKACVQRNIPIFPGAYTPTEVFNAWSLGASIVKIFPATVLGPGFIKDLKAPLSHIKVMPTGGVGLDNISAFKKAGADGYGIGGELFNKEFIKEKNWKALQEHFTSFVNALA